MLADDIDELELVDQGPDAGWLGPVVDRVEGNHATSSSPRTSNIHNLHSSEINRIF